MKKLLILILVIAVATPLWIYNNNWVLDKEDTLNYTPNRTSCFFFDKLQL